MNRRAFLPFIPAAVIALAATAFAADQVHTAGRHGLEGWSPAKITDEGQDKKEIDAELQDIHAAYANGDQQAVAARIDFPVFVVTDDWKGEVVAAAWDRDTWMQRMAPLFQHPAHSLQRAHKHNIFVISDSLASVDDEQSVVLGKKRVTIRSSSMLVRKDRRWFIKSTVEGGWGDTPLVKPDGESNPASAAGTGATSDGE